jgi:Sulfotransferase family
MNPYLFVVGCPRSGTTLLRRILNAHADIAIPRREQHWVTRYFKKKKRLTPEGLITPQLIEKLSVRDCLTDIGITRDDLVQISKTSIEYPKFVQGIYELYRTRHGKKFVGDKTPGNVLDILLLKQFWPWAKFVHIIRDGRDIYLSTAEWEKLEHLKSLYPIWSDAPVLTAAAWWKWHIDAGKEAKAVLDSSEYYEIKYEDLVSNSETEMRKLCEFLELPYNESMLHFHEGKTVEGKDAKHSWRPITPGLRDWRKQMTTEDRLAFESIAGKVLQDLGYECSSLNPLILSNKSRAIEDYFRGLQVYES